MKDPRQLLTINDLVSGDDAIFSATGVSDGELVDGVRFLGGDLVETLPSSCAAKQKQSAILKHTITLTVNRT